MTFPLLTHASPTTHMAIIGASGYGKSMAFVALIRSCVRQRTGLTLLDPPGSTTRAAIEIFANPVNGLWHHPVFFFDPASDHTLGINPLEIEGDVTDERAAECANVVTRVIEAKFGASPEQTPRLARLAFVLSFVAARHRGTLLDVLKLSSLGGGELRRMMLRDLHNPVIRNELADLDALPPARFSEVTESLHNRLVRWMADPRMARMLGQPRGINPRALMDQRAVVLFDLGALDYNDASFIGCLLGSMYFSHARRRVPDRAAPHILLLEEGESLLTIDSVRTLDQTRKFRFFIYAAIQRWAQAQRNEEVADALISNCGAWCAFRIPNPEHARFFAEYFALGPHLNLAEYKPGTERPIAVGSRKVLARNYTEGETRSTTRTHTRGHSTTIAHGRSMGHSTGRSHTRGHGSSSSSGQSDSWSLGEAQSHSHGSSLGESEGETDSSGRSSTRGQSRGHTSGTSQARVTGESASLSFSPPAVDVTDPATPSLHTPDLTEWYPTAPHLTGMSVGTSVSNAAGSSAADSVLESLADSVSHSSARSRSRSTSQKQSASTSHSRGLGGGQSRTRGQSLSESWGSSESVSEGISESIAEGMSESVADGTSFGTSSTQGVGETFITDYVNMPTALYTLEEQIARMQGALQSLRHREVIVRIHGEAPLRLRTPDVSPGFVSDRYRDVMLPRYLREIGRRNPYLIPVTEADQQLVRQPAPERDPAVPEPYTPVEDPAAFAAEFWAKRKKSKRPPLRIIKDGDND